MKMSKTVKPVDVGVSKTVLLAISVILLSIGVSIFSMIYVLGTYSFDPALYGLVLVWIGSLAFFYAVITEEHTMKEIFIRQGYFFTGILGMILAMFMISLAGFSSPTVDSGLVEFGLALLILSASLLLFSAQRTRDYSLRNGFFALFAGVLLMFGGIVASQLSVSYAGVFITIISAVWLGLRDRYAV